MNADEFQKAVQGNVWRKCSAFPIEERYKEAIGKALDTYESISYVKVNVPGGKQCQALWKAFAIQRGFKWIPTENEHINRIYFHSDKTAYTT